MNKSIMLDIDGAQLEGWAVHKFDIHGGPRNETSIANRYVLSYYWALMNLCTVVRAAHTYHSIYQ